MDIKKMEAKATSKTTPTFTELIAELIRQTEGLDAFGLIRFITANNIQSAFFGMILGV